MLETGPFSTVIMELSTAWMQKNGQKPVFSSTVTLEITKLSFPSVPQDFPVQLEDFAVQSALFPLHQWSFRCSKLAKRCFGPLQNTATSLLERLVAVFLSRLNYKPKCASIILLFSEL
jgi:hypothetical protein